MYCTRLNNNIYLCPALEALFFADYMASQPMPVAMGVPVQAVASPSPIPTAVPLEEAVPLRSSLRIVCKRREAQEKELGHEGQSLEVGSKPI